jgi:O-antigen ligase/Tfp pilus assembly protein PilF
MISAGSEKYRHPRRAGSMSKPQIRKLLSVGVPVFFLWFVAFEWVGRTLPAVQYVTRALFILCCLIWFALRLKSNRSFVLPDLTIPFAFFIAYQGIIIFRAPLTFHSFEVELTYIVYLLVFIFVVDSLHNWWKHDHWENALLNLAIIFSVLNLALVVYWWFNSAAINGNSFSTPPFGYRLPGLFLKHPNYEAAFLNLVAPIVLIRALQSARWSKRIGWAVVFALFLTVEFFTSSRAGWLALFVGCGTTLMLLGLPMLKRGRTELLRLINFLKTVKGVLLIVLILIGFIGFGLIFLWQANVTGHAPISSARVGIWAVGWNIFRTAPILGYGPGSFHVLSSVETQIPPGFYLVHAHNLFLQVAAEGGIVGILILTLIAGFGFRAFLRAWRKASGSRKNRLAAYAGVAVAMAAHHLFDFAFEAPLYTISVLIITALAIYDLRENSFTLSPRKWGLPILSGLVSVYLIGSIYALRGSSLYFNGVQLAKDNQWEQGTGLICQSAEENHQLTLFDFQCGLAEATSAIRLEETNRVVSAVFYISRGLDHDPFWPVHWANLAALEWSLGHHSKGLELMEKAVELAPRNSTFALNLGWMYAQTGNTDAARSAYRQAILVDPWLIETTAYTRLIGQRIDSAKLIQEIQRYRSWRNPGVGWSEFTKGHYKDAEYYFKLAIEVNPRNVDAYSGLALVYLQSKDLSNAERMAKLALLNNTSSPRAHIAAGQVALDKGDKQQAIDHFAHMFTLISTNNQSSPYYESAYFRTYLPFDRVPQMHQALVSEEILEALELLVGLLQELGEEDDAQEVLYWINSQIH